MALLVDVLSWAFILAGSALMIVGAIGLVRMPDVFTRMHATSVSDTAGAGLLLVGMMLQAGFSFVTLKLIFIALIFFFAGPVATHALTRAALSVGIEPVLMGPDGRKRPVDAKLLARLRGRTPRGVSVREAEVDPAKATPRRGKAGSKPRGGRSSKRS